MASDNETSCVCDPNFAVICSFLEKFAKSCGISHPNILELQEMLENSQEVPQPLVDLHVKLLRKARKSVSGERWEKAIIKFCHSYSNQDGWEIERFGYKKARISVKLRILKMLLELQFDLNTKFKTEVNRLSADELRCQPLGRDKMGQTYWCQLDEDCNLRVYREDLDDETWEVVARDRDGLVQLISQLSSNDPFRKDTEEILNEDSNSLEIEKPITDTGQAIVLQKEVAAETVDDDDDDDEEFEEIDDEESEDKDDIPRHGNIEKSCAADKEEDKKESNVEKKEFKEIEEKTEPKENCMLNQTEENKTNLAESTECTSKEAEPTQKCPNLNSESERKAGVSKEENMMKSSEPDHLLQTLENETSVLKLEESKKQCVLKHTESEEEQQIFNSSKSKEENVIKTIEFKETDTKPVELKDDDLIKTSEPREKEMLEHTESKEENMTKTVEPKEKEILKPAKSKELHVIKTTAIKEKEITKLAKSKEENVMKTTEPKEKEILEAGDSNGGSSFEPRASKDDSKLKITESKEREIESKDKCVLTPVESESSGYKELKPSKFKEDALKNNEQTNKHVLRTTDNVNRETTAKTAPEMEDTQNRFSSVNKEIERHVPRSQTNNPSQDNMPQSEFIGMDLSKPSQPRVLEPPISKNVGIDLTSKLYTEEHSVQQLVKIEDMNESSTSNSSLVAEDLSDASKRTQSNPENFDHKRFVPHPLTATDLSTKRPIDLLKSSKVTIMNSMPGFSSLSVNRLNLSGKRLHESDIMTNEAKKLRLEQTVAANCHKIMPPIVGPPLPHFGSGSFDSEDSTEVGEAIEEPLMLVRGEGSGADCNTGNPGKEGENEKSNHDSSKSDEISAGGGAGQSGKSAVSNDKGNISTNKGEASGKASEISNQETKINLSKTSNTTIADISGGSTLSEVNLSKDEKDVQINCENTLALSVEKLTEENERCSNLNTKKPDVHGESWKGSAKDKALSVLETSCEAKKIHDPGEDKEKLQSATNKMLCLDRPSLKEESCQQSPPKHSPKLWSIETICAPDGKSKDNPKTGSGSTKVCGNSFLGVVSDSLYGDKYSAKFQDVESGGRVNPSSSSSSPSKRPSRWDVGGDDKLQKMDQSESNDKSSILQNASSTSADISEQKMDKLHNTNLGPVTEEQNVAGDVLPAVEVCRPSKNITESRVQVCQKQKFKFDIENIITKVAEKEKTKPPLISNFDVKANMYIGKLQIAEAERQGRKEGSTPEKEAEALECGTQECLSSEQSAEKNGSDDTNANLEKLPSQGFFFGPGCLLKSPIKKTNDGINSSNTRDSVKIDVAESDSSERQTSMSMLPEHTNKVIGESVSEMFEMNDEGGFSEISSKCPKITSCAASSSQKNDSPLKSKTLHSIDTIMSSHRLKETDNIPQTTESCVPFSAEVSLLETQSCASEKKDHENPLQVKEAGSGSELKGVELVSSQSCSETLEGKVRKLSQNEKEEASNQLFPKEKTNEKESVKTVIEGFSSSIFEEKHTFSDAKKECGKNISSLIQKTGLQSQVVKTEGDTASEQSKTCLGNEDNTHVKKFKSEILASGKNTSKCAQSDINRKSLDIKEPNILSGKSCGSSEEKESSNDSKRKGTLEVLSSVDSNKKTSVETSDSAKKDHNSKERSTNTVSKDREKVLTHEKKEKSDRSPTVSVESEDARAVREEHPDINKSKLEEGKEIIRKSADGIATKLSKENKSEILIKEPHPLASSSQNEGVSHVSKHQAKIKEQKLEANTFISVTEKGDLVSPDKCSMNEKLSAIKTDSDQQLRDHIKSSSYVKSLNSLVQKPSDSKTSLSDLKKNINKLVKSEPKLDEKPGSSILAPVPSKFEKPIEESIIEHEDRHPKDSSEDEVSSNLGKCIEINVRNDARKEGKISEIMNLNTSLDGSKQKHENVTSSEESKSKLPHLLQLPEKTIGSKSMNVLKVDKVKSSLSSNVAHKQVGERADKLDEKGIPDFSIKDEEKKTLLDMKLGGGISSAVSESKLSHLTSDRGFQCMKSQALHSESKNENMSSDQTNLNSGRDDSKIGTECKSGRDDSKKGTDCVISNVGCKVKTDEIITDVGASISKSTGKFPDKPASPTHRSLHKTEMESCIALARKAQTEILNISLEKTVGQSDTVLKKKADVISTVKSEDKVKTKALSTSASQSQQKSIENSSQIEIKSVLSSADAHENKTFRINESEIADKTSHIDSSKPLSEHLSDYSETVSDPASINKALTSNNPTKECHENVSAKDVKSKSLSLSIGIESLNNLVKITKPHDLPKEAITLPIGAENKQGEADITVLSEVKIDSVSPSLKSCETKSSSIVTPKTKADIRDNSEGNTDTKKNVISAEKGAATSDNFTNSSCENITCNIPNDEVKSISEKIEEADKSQTIPLKTVLSVSLVEDKSSEVERKASTSLEKVKENPFYFHENIKREFDSSDEIKAKIPCLSPKNKSQVENVSKKIQPIVSETISDNNTNKVCSAIKCETSEKTEKKSLLSVKGGEKNPQLDSNAVNSSLHKDDSKVPANKKEKDEPRNQNQEERTDNNLDLKDNANITITQRNLAIVSPLESEKHPLQKSASVEENEETFRRDIQPNVEQISSVAKKIIDLSSVPKKALLKSGLEKKVIKHDEITEKTFDIGKLAPVSESVSECNNSNVLEKKLDKNVQKEEKFVIVSQESSLKKNVKDTIDPNDISHTPKHKAVSEIVPDLLEDENKIGKAESQKGENVGNKTIISPKAEEETKRSSHSETEKTFSPSFSEGSQKGVVEDKKTVTALVDVPTDKKVCDISLNKSKSHHKDESAQALIKEMPSADDKHLEKGIPALKIVLLHSDEESSEKCTQNVKDTEISTKSLPSSNTEVSNSFPDTSPVQNKVDKPGELQSSIKESVKHVPSKSSITKPSTILGKVKNEFQNKGRRKSLESISMGIMMRKVAAKSSLQEPVNTSDGNVQEEITKLPEESAPTNQVKLVMPSSSCQENESSVKFESHKISVECDKSDSLTSESNAQGSDNKASIQNTLEVTQITEPVAKFESSTEHLSETEGMKTDQADNALEKKESSIVQKGDDLMVEADQIPVTVKKTEEVEKKEATELMPRKEASIESKQQVIPGEKDDGTLNPEVDKIPDKDKQDTVSASSESKDCKNSKSKLKNTENKLGNDNLFTKEKNKEDASSNKDSSSIVFAEVESTNKESHETSKTLQFADIQKLTENKKQEDISLLKETGVTDERTPSVANDPQRDNTPNVEIVKQYNFATISTENQLEKTSSPKVDTPDTSVAGPKDLVGTEQSSEEDVANDDSCYIPDNDSLVDQESDDIKAASPSNQKHSQKDEEILRGKQSRVEESLVLEETGGASSSEGEQGGEPDGSSYEGESEAGAAGKRGGSVTQARRKSGRGRRGRGRGSRGRSRAQRANAGKSASPVPPSGASEDDKKEVEPITPVTPTKTKGNRGKRAPKLMGLDLGVDIVLEQSRGDEEGRPGAPPVRQSRRIAQMKIREEAERRKLEEMTLQQLKEEQSRRRADARAEKKELKEGKKRKKKAIESDEDFTAEEVDEETSSKKKMKKKKRRKKKPALSFNESNPWQSSSGSSTSQEEDEEGEQSEEEEDDEELIFKSDHEFSPESDLENDGTEVTPMRRARTAQKGLPCEDEEQPTDEHACQKCGKSDHPEWILLCDKCDSGWHCSCLRPALMVIPEGDWFCPPCEHTFLLENLHNNLLEFDRNWKRRENEELRRKRLAYVGISLDNVLPNKEGSGGESDTELKKEPVAASLTGSEVSGSESGTSSDEDSEPVYQLRQRRQTLFSYRFNEYDDLINSAIQDEMEAVKGAGNQGRGKDIATIVKAEAEAEAVAQAQAQAQEQAIAEEMQTTQNVAATLEESAGKVEEKEEPISEEMEKEELPPVVPKHDIKDEEEEEDEFCPFKKFQIRKKHRRLNSLDISSEDDAESDEDFKGTSSEDDEDEYEGSEGESEDSEFRGRRGKGSRRRVSGPVRRSSRARITRFDKEFINDDSEDSEPPKKKSRKLWQDSDSEDSDASWRRSKRSKKQVTTFKTIKTKSKKKKKKRSKRDGDSDLEVYRAKKPKIKYGGLEEDEISPTRRTRGRKINYQELAASDSEEETWGRVRKLESEDEYVANEEEEEEEEDEVLPEQEKDSENESGELTEMKKVNRTKQDKKIKPKRAVKSSPEKFVRKGKRGPKTNKKAIIDSEEDIPPCTGVQVPSENEDPTFGFASHQSVNTQTSEAELQSCSVVNVPIGNLPKERKGRTRGQGRKQEEQKKKGKRKKKNENASFDFTEGLAPGFQTEKGDAGLLGKQLADVQLLPAQSRMGAEISVKGGETLMQRLTAAGRTVPISLGSNPDLLPEADRAMLLQSAKGAAETDPLRSLLAAPPVISSDGDLKVSEDIPPPAGKRKGRGRGKAAAAKAVDVSHYPLQNFPQSGSGIGNTSNSSVITRMLQSQPVSGAPQSFTAAATAMGHKYFGSSSGEPSLMPMQNAGRGTSSVPPYSGPPKGLSSPYRQPPPTDTNNSGLGPAMGHYSSSPSTRGSGIRGPPGFQQTGGMRLRNPPPSGQPHMFHTSHHPMDPSPSGGGPIIISSAAAPPPPPAGSPHSSKPGTPSTSQNTPTPPPPPPYSRPGSQLPLVPPTSTTMASMMQFPSQPGDSSQPPVRHPPPPFPPSTSASHLQTSQGTPQSSPPTHQGRSPVPGNFSPYHPPPPANYHYGGYPPPPPMSAADDALPPSAFQGSPYTDHYTSSDMTANLQASDGSNSKSYDEEGGGEFGGLVSYFSSQREDDLDT